MHVRIKHTGCTYTKLTLDSGHEFETPALDEPVLGFALQEATFFFSFHLPEFVLLQNCGLIHC